MRIRIKDIADQAGVSTGTVDRVIHNRGEVALKTRKKVMLILDEMHYEPDILASSLASRSPLKVAVLLPFHTSDNLFWKEPLSGIYEAYAELNHFGIEIREFLYDQFVKQEFQERVVDLFEFSPDAVITAPVFNRETSEFFNDCSEKGIPFISLNANISHPRQVSYVGQDSERSGAVAAKLIKMGFNGKGRVLVISIAMERDNYHHILNRERGFGEFWKNGNGSPAPEIISQAISSDSYAYIKKKLESLFEQYDDIRGIFVTNSKVYLVARFLHSAGKKHITLVGYDLIEANIKYLNNETIDFLISQKPREQGYKALISIFNMLKLNKQPSPEQLISIDIICKENLCCYQV